MQMQSELFDQRFRIHGQTVVFATLLQQSQIQLVVLTTENLPRHFNVAVGRNVDRSWRRQFFQRQTQCPAAEDIPLLNAGAGFQAN